MKDLQQTFLKVYVTINVTDFVAYPSVNVYFKYIYGVTITFRRRTEFLSQRSLLLMHHNASRYRHNAIPFTPVRNTAI
jgi:hypothetical protein